MTEAPGLSKPVLPGTAGSDYERYLRTDELLALQKTSEQWTHRDELLFQTVHQSSELWLKLAWNEVEEAARERAGLSLVEVYTRGREFDALYNLAEQLIEWDERVIVWRVRHFKVVQRVIGGDVIGTQGTPVEVMGRLIHKSYFPELWNVRNELTYLNPPD